MIIIYLAIVIIILKLLFTHFKNKYTEKKNVIVVNSKKEYDKIQKTINDSIAKETINNKLKEYIDTIS